MEPDACTIVKLKTLTLRQVVKRDGDLFSLACLASADGVILRIVLCRIVVCLGGGGLGGGGLGGPLNSDADLMLDGGLRVAYARILELRKLNGKRRVPRLSVKAADASCCLAVVLPLIRASGRWLPDRTKAPVLVPLVNLGRRAVATEGTGARAGTFAMQLADEAAGGHKATSSGRRASPPTCSRQTR